MANSNQQAFFELVRAGLWEKEARLSQYKDIDFSQLLRLAETQAVVGLVAAGIEHVVDVKIPKEDVLQMFIEGAIRESEPDIIITHHPADTNNDHLQTSMACREAIRLFQRRPEVKPLGMYRGVMRPYPHPRSAVAIEGLAAYRGSQAACTYAEAFELVMRRC